MFITAISKLYMAKEQNKSKDRQRATHRKVGRPSDYSPRYIDKVYMYVKQEQETGKLPKLCGLRVVLGYCRNTLIKWAEEHKEFALALEYLDDVQESMLIDKGLDKSMNSAVAKLMLYNHGYRERHDDTSGDKPLTPQIIIFQEKENDNTKQ